MLAVVLRYGMGRRRRVGLEKAVDRQEGDGSGSPPVADPIDDVEAMVAGVKSRGVGVFCALPLQSLNIPFF
jgi:hypothetical protein